jgi:K+-transporting ATPase KdpF subunit
MCGRERGVFLDCDCLHDGLRAVGCEGEMMIETLLLGLVTVLLLVYLVYALLRPEKF